MITCIYICISFKETEIWFPANPTQKTLNYILPAPDLTNCTCCIVKPHAVTEGTLGPILNYINEKKFKIIAMEMFNLDVSAAEEFLEVYKGVVPEYSVRQNNCLISTII